MKEKILGKFKTPSQRQLISGSFVIFIGSVVGYILNYLYNVIIGRMLGPAEYGHLVALTSLVYLLTFPLGAISTVIIKFTTAFKSKNEEAKVYSLLVTLSKKFAYIGFAIFLVLIFSSKFLTDFLKLPDIWGVLIIGLGVGLSLNSAVNMSVIQGLLNFKFLTFLNSVSPVIRLISSVVFVYLGFKSTGAFFGSFLAGAAGLALTLIPLSKLRKWRFEEIHIDWKEVRDFAAPAALTMFFFTLMANMDILLVKHYFAETEAGIYAAMAVVAKVILFLPGPVQIVLFPILVENKEKGEKVEGTFWLAFGLIGLASLTVTILYSLNSQFWMNIFFGKGFTASAASLPLFGVFMSLYSLNSTFVSYFLAQNITRVFILTSIAAISQIGLIVLFHASFFQVIFISSSVSLALLVSFIIYYKLLITYQRCQ